MPFTVVEFGWTCVYMYHTSVSDSVMALCVCVNATFIYSPLRPCFYGNK